MGTLCNTNILHHLNLNCNIISDQTAAKICEVIAASTYLNELEIGSCNISGHGFRLIAESLMNDNKILLQHLNIKFNAILFNAAESISTTLCANKLLEHLDLSGCKLGERDFVIICKSLRNNVLLTHLNLSHNSITCKVAAEIASIISGNGTLQYVNFHNCNLQDDGAKYILDGLCNVKTLRVFITSNNPAISIDSAKHIANVISSNTFIEQIDLSNCKLKDNGVRHIINSLCNVKTLRTFIASDNPSISMVSVQSIADIIYNNTFLEHFDLSNCNLQESSIRVISQAANKTSTLKYIRLD